MLSGMTLPLSTLLSQALVAFTIEADYEFERVRLLWSDYAAAGMTPLA